MFFKNVIKFMIRFGGAVHFILHRDDLGANSIVSIFRDVQLEHFRKFV